MVFNSCKKENLCDCIKRTGNVSTELRTNEGFNSILVYNKVDVYITEGSNFEVSVEAGDNIRDLIDVEIKDSVLSIDNNNKCNWTRSYKKPIAVHITCPSLKYISVEGSGNIKSTNTLTPYKIHLNSSSSGVMDLKMDATIIEVSVNSIGDVNLQGETGLLLSDIGGTAFLNCKKLLSDYIYLHCYTTGICSVNTSQTIDCKIDDIGDIYCYGNPSNINKEENSSGRLYLK